MVKRILLGDESQEAKSGVTFHTTAPVVPPARLEERTAGDWVMVRSWLLMVRSRVVALASMKPRFWEGWDWEKRRKASVEQCQCPFFLKGEKTVHAFFIVFNIGSKSA